MRTLHENEIADLLASDVIAHLATIDSAGYPHITPMWFLWSDGAFYLTCFTGRPHLDRIRSNHRVGLVIDIEDALRPDGQRPNQQIRVIGDATVRVDPDGEWTRRIRRKYIGVPVAPTTERSLIMLVPTKMHAVASV
jgi:nitroimidazol reductase NimA-like FMN-containing flavoprotein (pyridoxamine 5'-phosphate oxidase superfamily)